jgi:hypothetical protein
MGNLAACGDVVIWAIGLKRGMELQPWAPCIGRLATTAPEARALLADAVRILAARAQGGSSDKRSQCHVEMRSAAVSNRSDRVRRASMEEPPLCIQKEAETNSRLGSGPPLLFWR